METTILQGWMGPNYSISAACATSNICILNAASHIIGGETVSGFISCDISYCMARFYLSETLRDMQDVMLCGGSDSAIIPIG